MENDNDPRMRGFNYGSTVHAGPNPPIYHTAMAIARELAKEATRTGQHAWALEMAIRDVRHSCTTAEKLTATRRLEQHLKPYLN